MAKTRQQPHEATSMCTSSTAVRQMAWINQLDAIVHGSGAVVFRWRVAEGWPVEFVSGNVERLLGYTAEEFMSGRVSWPAITHPDDVPRLEAEVAGFLEQGIMEFSQEYRLLTKAGDVKWVEDRNMAIVDSKGEITHVQGLVLDVSQRKALEHEILDATSRHRERLGVSIHDTLAQQLAGAGYLAASLEKELAGKVLPPSSAAFKVASLIRDSLHQALTIARSLSLAGMGVESLAFGLKQLASATQQMFGVPCECVIEKPIVVRDEGLAVQLYRIAQDAVDLAIRRGNPRQIGIHLSTKRTKGSLVIQYDGTPVFAETGDIEARLIRCRAEMMNARLDMTQETPDRTVITCSFDPRVRVEPSSTERGEIDRDVG